MPDLGHLWAHYLKTDAGVQSEQAFPWHRQFCPTPGGGEMEFFLERNMGYKQPACYAGRAFVSWGNH